MSTKCTNCQSFETQAMLGDRYTCLRCGAHFDAATGAHMPTDGQPLPPPLPEPAPTYPSSEWPGPADEDAQVVLVAEPDEPDADVEPVTSGRKSKR